MESGVCSLKLACSKTAECSLWAVLVRQWSRLRKLGHKVWTNQNPSNNVIFSTLASDSNCKDPSDFVLPSFQIPHHKSLCFLPVGKNYLIESLLILLLRLLIFWLFYPVRSGIQIYRHVNDTEAAIMMLNRPALYKVASLRFRSKTETCHDVSKIILYTEYFTWLPR